MRIASSALKTYIWSSLEQGNVLSVEFTKRQACGVSERPPGVNMKKHMNINEDADEKRGTVLRKLFWINEALEQGLN